MAEKIMDNLKEAEAAKRNIELLLHIFNVIKFRAEQIQTILERAPSGARKWPELANSHREEAIYAAGLIKRYAQQARNKRNVDLALGLMLQIGLEAERIEFTLKTAPK